MPPKRKQVDSEEEEDYSSADSGSDFAPSEDEQPKKKAPAKKKAPPKKAPAKKKAAVESPDGPSPKAAAAKPKKPKPDPLPTVPTVVGNGWTLHPPSLIYKLNPDAQGGAKIACFDLDQTLVVPRSKAQFPKNADDWRWLNKDVPKLVREAYADGYQILIVSNQGGVKKALTGVASQNVRQRVDNMLAELNDGKQPDVPVQVFMATQSDEYRKPDTGMWDLFVQMANKGVQPDKSQSYFVGDAAGRDGDHSDGDKMFAANVGIKFFTPEEKFGEPKSASEECLNPGLASAFRKLAEINKDQTFKANAYNTVAAIIEGWPNIIKSAKDLAGTKGVGPSSQAKITEFLETGTLAALEEAGLGAAAAAAAPRPVDKSAAVGLKFI